MTETDTQAPEQATDEAADQPAPPRVVELVYDGATWEHHMAQPTEGQITLMLGLIDMKGVNDVRNATPDRIAAAQKRALRGIRRAQSLAEGLSAVDDEYDRLINAIALKRPDATEGLIYDLIIGCLMVWTEDEATNRAGRRAKRATPTKARRG